VEYAAPLFYVAVNKDGDKRGSGCEGPQRPERKGTVGDLLERLTTLQVGVILIWQGLGSCIGHLLAVLLELLVVDGDLGGSKSGSGDELQLGVANQFPGEPQEGLLEVVVGLGGDVVVLEVLLAVEGDGLGLDLALLHVDLVTGEDDGDVLADTDEVTVPVGNVLVGDTGGNIEHDDTTLSVNVVTVTETTELLLASGIPDIELDRTVVGVEKKRVNLDTESGDVLLLEFTSQVTLDESGLSSTTVTDQDELESGFVLRSGHVEGYDY
jgi:hypothetical protein